MKAHHVVIIGINLFCCFSLESVASEELPSSPAWGIGKQFAFGEDIAPPPAFPRVVSDLTKGESNFQFKILAADQWQVTSNEDGANEVLASFSGPRFERTRLVDVRRAENRVDLLLVHSHGYYLIVVNKISGSWVTRLILGIPQVEFLKGAGDARDPSITSAAISADGSVVIKRIDKPEASYGVDLASLQISSVSHGTNDAYVIYSKP